MYNFSEHCSVKCLRTLSQVSVEIVVSAIFIPKLSPQNVFVNLVRKMSDIPHLNIDIKLLHEMPSQNIAVALLR